MTKFGDMSSKFPTTNIEFQISTSGIGHLQNLVKIRTLLLFDPKCPNVEIWAQNV